MKRSGFRVYLETDDVLVVEDSFDALGASIRIQFGADNIRLGFELAKKVAEAIRQFVDETESAAAKREKQ